MQSAWRGHESGLLLTVRRDGPEGNQVYDCRPEPFDEPHVWTVEGDTEWMIA